MASVYLAFDLRHDRKVALKRVLPQYASGQGAQRFLREIGLAAKLQHPHILPLFDSGEVDGAPWYVMPLVEGESLRDRLARERELPIEDALRIASEIAGALSYAHAHGVVHRDIKPENVLLSDGHALVMDFGIARAAAEAGDATLTETGMSLGTPAYMSPEQATGEKNVDGRTDLYALGCVLYEMLAGQTPYVSPTGSGMLHQHIAAAVPDVRMLRPGVPEEAAKLLTRMLAKSPADRPRTAAQVIEGLEKARRVVAAGAAPSRPVAHRAASQGPALVIVAASMGAVLLAGLGGWFLHPHGSGVHGIAVLPLANLSGDPGQEYFADGMTEQLIDELGHVSALRVISRTSVMAFKNAHEPLPVIARKLGVDAVVEGTVVRTGMRVRVSADLVQVHPEKSLWSDRYDRDLRDALAIQSEVAQAIAEQVKAKLTPQERQQLAQSQSRHVDPAAQDEYLKGRYYLNKISDSGYRTAISHFERAIEIDPAYAAAWASLADAYYQTSNLFLPPDQAIPKAREAAEKSLQLDPALAAAHRALGLVQSQYDMRWAESESSYVRSLRLDPSESSTHLGYGYVLEEQGRLPEAIAQGDEAVRLDPLSPFAQGMTAYTYYLAGQYDESKRRYQAMTRADSNYAVPFYSIALCDLELGLTGQAMANVERAERIGDNPFGRAMRAYALAASGHRTEALALLDSLTTDPKVHFSSVWSAWVYGAAGDLDRAFASIDKALDARDEDLMWIQVDPKFKWLRGDPRYPAVLKRMGLRS